MPGDEKLDAPIRSPLAEEGPDASRLNSEEMMKSYSRRKSFRTLQKDHNAGIDVSERCFRGLLSWGSGEMEVVGAG
jgi:hypothetical protein